LKYNCNDVIIAFDKQKGAGAVLWKYESGHIHDHLTRRVGSDWDTEQGGSASDARQEAGTMDDFIGGLAYCIAMQMDIEIATRNSARALRGGRIYFS